MRDLTAEELALAPEWATHYSVNTSSNWISVCFFNERKVVNLIDGKIGGVYFNEFGIEDGDREVVRVKPFDISKHEFGDTVEFVELDGDELTINCTGLNYIELYKDDEIAIAKALGVTSEDLRG